MVPRRSLLRALAASVAGGVAGCASFERGGTEHADPDDRTTAVSPTTTLTPSPASEAEPASPTTPSTQVARGTDAPPTGASPTPSTPMGVTQTPARSLGSTVEVDEFGSAVGLSGETAVVVAEEQGAYVFEADAGWENTTVLKPDGSEGFGGYNESATVVDDVAVVGGPGAGPDTDGGAVYLFERRDDRWEKRYRFESGEEDHDEFGRSVGFDGERVVVGDAHDPETMVPWIGDAYVFEGAGTDWTRVANLGTEASDLFGTAVAVDGDTILVGAPYAEHDGGQTGAVYAFERAGGEWQREAVLSSADVEGEARFGESIALRDGTAVVGAPGDRTSRGSAVVFERATDGWHQVARSSPPEGVSTGGFGQSVASVGSQAVVGADGEAYVVGGGDDREVSLRLTTGSADGHADFGTAVALADDAALVGSPVFDAPSAAYLYAL